MMITGPTVDHGEIRVWAEHHKMLPTEILPNVVDHEPPVLQLLPAKTVQSRPDVRVISWEEFFARFDLLGLAFIYDNENTGYNELLQRDEKTPRLSDAYRPDRLKN